MNLGQLVITSTVHAAMNNNPVFRNEIEGALDRYVNRDWGNISKDAWKANDKALSSNNQIFAVYKTSLDDIFIITEWDRSATTILFPCEH